MSTTHQHQPQQRTSDPKIKRFWSEFTADHTVLPYDPDSIAKKYNDLVEHDETMGPDAAAAIINEHTTATIPSRVVEHTWEHIDDLTKWSSMEVVAELMHTHAVSIIRERNQPTTEETPRLLRTIHTTKNAVAHFALFMKSKATGSNTSQTIDDTPSSR